MAQVRLDFTGDTQTLITQIAQVINKIGELNRSAADVYAMRGDMGMIGLQRQIQAANTELTNLKTQLQSLGSFDPASLQSRFSNLDTTIKSASASARVFQQNLSTMASTDPVTRQPAAMPDYSKAFVPAVEAISRTIDRVTGLDREMKSASASARVFGGSLRAASDADGINRVTAAQQRENQAIQDSIVRLNKQAAARAESVLYPADKAPQRIGSAFGDIEAEVGQKMKHGVMEADSAVTGLSHSFRHIIALFDEAARGQRGAFISSIGALIRDQQAVQGIIGALVSPWGMVAA